MTTTHALAERFAELTGDPLVDPVVLPTRVFAAATTMRPPTVRPLVELFTRATVHIDSDLVGAQPTVDSTSRIGLGKAAAAMGWTAAAAVTARIDGSRVQLRLADAGLTAGPDEGPVRLDAQCRLTLTPGMRLALGVRPSMQVQVIADPSNGQVMLLSMTRALQMLLGADPA